jgi:hypothetical protein
MTILSTLLETSARALHRRGQTPGQWRPASSLLRQISIFRLIERMFPQPSASREAIPGASTSPFNQQQARGPRSLRLPHDCCPDEPSQGRPSAAALAFRRAFAVVEGLMSEPFLPHSSGSPDGNSATVRSPRSSTSALCPIRSCRSGCKG